MAISDAQFSAWLASDQPRRVVCELAFAYESGGAPATGTIYLADGPFTSKPTDNPPSVRYHSVIARLPRFRRAIDRRTLGGRAELTVSDMVLANNGELDELLDAIVDGHEARFYLGSPDWPRADFRLAFVAVAERFLATNDSELVLKLRDKRLLLDREVIGNQVGGTGAEKDQFLPSLWGSVFNLAARVYDESTAKYAVISNYTGGTVQDVRDNGSSLTANPVTTEDGSSVLITVDAGTDTFTLASHGLALNDVVTFQQRDTFGAPWFALAPFAGVSSVQYWVISPATNTFQLSLTKGGSAINVTGTTYLGPSGAGFPGGRLLRRRFYDDVTNAGRIELSSSPVGRVTVDCTANTSYTLTPFAFLSYLITTYGKVSASEVDTASFTAADTALDSKVTTAYTNYLVQARSNLLDVVDDLSRASFGWVGQDRSGLITCGLVDVSGIDSATATRTIGGSSLAGQISVEVDLVGPGRASVQFSPNQTIQSDGLDGSVTQENRRRYATPFLEVQRTAAGSGTAYSTNPGLFHKTMVEAEPVSMAQLSTFLGYNSGITLGMGDIAAELVADAAPHRQFISVPCRLDCYDVDLGAVVSLVYPRYGMAAGVNARVIGVTVDLSAGRVDLELVRRKSPDTTTASYH